MRPFLCALAMFASLFVSIDASAHGGIVSRQRIVTRQKIIQPVVRQRVVVQQVVSPVAVQAVYAAPIVAQPLIVPQAIYSAPLIQSYSSGCGVSQQLRLRQSVGGCSQFFH